MAGNSGSFKPGQIGNPTGRPKLPDDLRHLMRSTGEQIRRDICKVMSSTHSEIQELSTKMDIPVGIKMIASCADNCIQTGDNKILATFLDRLIGKPAESEPFSPDDDDKPKDDRDQTIAKLVDMITERPNG